jgi:sulfite exporter TauE/SafE
LNREHIDYALVGVLEGAKEVELGEKEVEPKNLKGLLYLFIAWLVIIAGLTIATIVASHLHKSHQVKYITDAKACLNQNGPVTTIGWSPFSSNWFIPTSPT